MDKQLSYNMKLINRVQIRLVAGLLTTEQIKIQLINLLLPKNASVMKRISVLWTKNPAAATVIIQLSHTIVGLTAYATLAHTFKIIQIH